jgi:hypothetical protein
MEIDDESPYELFDDRFRACQGDKRLRRLFSEGRWLGAGVFSGWPLPSVE